MGKNLTIRFPEELHERLVKIAKQRNQSLNALIVSVLETVKDKKEEERIEEIERRLDAIEKEVFRK